MEIVQLTEATPAALSDLNKLLKQLRIDTPDDAGSLDELEAIARDPNAVMMVAKDGEKIVGVATLYILQKLSKRVSHVEDVVVDAAYRGQHLGEKIVQALIDVAREKNIKSLFLTSRPARIAANKLYQKLGFKIKETNPYSMKL